MSATQTEIETQRARHMAHACKLVPAMIERLGWDADRLAEYRTERLRELVRVAVARSAWHRARLAGIDPATFTPADVASLPVMTKADLMANFDAIVTDRRLTLAGVEGWLESVGTAGYLDGGYTAIASGGSTGTRGVVVYDWDGWAVFWVSAFRDLIVAKDADPELAGRPLVLGWVMAAHMSHGSAALARTFVDARFVNHRFPVSLPVAEIVAGLNKVQPDVLAIYPSMLHVLAHEAADGRLRIAPRLIIVCAEPLLPETRAAAEAAFGVPVRNLYGASEAGAISSPCGLGSGHLTEDLLIVEPVDADGRPVPPGTRSAKVYVTNLFNHAMPLIRYELTDEVTVLAEPCPCGAATPCVADVQGRLDDGFAYGDVRVHPHVFRSALTTRAGIVEYRVSQTPAGAAVEVRCDGAVDLAALEGQLAGSLRALGVPDPVMTVRQVEALDRLPGTGKLKRFVPLPAAVLSGAAR